MGTEHRWNAMRCDEWEDLLMDGVEPGEGPSGEALARHLEACPACAEFAAGLCEIGPLLERIETEPVPQEIVDETIQKASACVETDREVLKEETARVVKGLVAAGLLALPLVIGLNYFVGWSIYHFAATILPKIYAQVLLSMFVVWVTVSISFTYASLPFVALASPILKERYVHGS